jgi:hypothetical protein
MTDSCPTGSPPCSHAEAAADQAVAKTFAILGVDINDPQQVAAFQESLRFNDRLRKIADKSVMAFVLAMVAVGASAFILGLKAVMLGKSGG